MFWIGRLCEEFPALTPEAALDQWDRAPVGFFQELLETRAYVRAKQMVDTAKKKSDLPQTPLIALIQEIEFDLVAEDRRG